MGAGIISWCCYQRATLWWRKLRVMRERRELNVWTETNKPGVKTAWASDRWFGYLSNISLVRESKLYALEKWAFDVEAEAWTGKREIWVCFPLGYTTKEREYFKMPPSSLSLDSFRLLAKWARGYRPSSLLRWAVLYNVLIDFRLGITDDTSAPARARKDLPHLSL